MELDDDQDTHICLKCQTTIIGLDNYVAHKKRGCLIDKTTRDEHRPEEATRETSTTTSTTHYQHVVILPAGSAPASNETRSSLEHLDEDDEDDEEADEEDEEGEVKPDDFFLSLELQSNSKTMDRKSSPKKDSDGIKKEEEEEEADDVADQHGSGTAPEADDDENDEDENNEGKRARSTADQKTNTPGHTSSIEGELQEGVIPPGSAPKKPLLVIGKRRLFARRVTRHVSWSCPICDVSFKKEAQMVSHLASREHWQQSKNHPDHSDLIFQFGSALVTQSLFKCSICSFYCNSHEDFLRHWGSPQELHVKNLEQHGGFHCVPCNYECWKANDMEEHLKDTAHTTSLSPINPLEVRASSLRCPKCEWTTDKYRALQSHIKLAHAAKAFFHCNICQEDFAEHETLLEHWKADDHWSKCHKCMHCSFVTDRLPRLVVHLRTVHKDDSKLQTALPTSVNNNQDVQNKPNVPISTIVTISKEDTMLEEEAENSIMSENNENSRETAYNKKFRKPLNTVHLCMFCGSKQDNGLSMKEHVTRHHPEKLIRCLPCCATFVFESQYQKHLASRVHQCNVMGENDESSSGNQLYACDQCPFQCRNHAGILFHQTMHAGPVSEEIAAIHEEMQNALKQENEAAKMLLVSKTSDAEFLQDVTTGEAGEDDDDDDDDAGQPQGAEDSNGMDRGKMIKKKKQSRKKRPDRLYCCPLCDKMFTPFRLRIHLNVHTGECPFVCTICGMSYTRKDSLYSHHRNTHKEKQYACPQCPYRSSRKGKINEHILTHKVRPRKFLCDTCGAGFYKKYSLLHHQKLHTGVKVHKCDVPGCGRAFRCPSELVYHKRVHTDERPFLCDTCGYAAKTRHQLTKHERTHTGARPFPCPHCSYSAALGPQLRRHMRIHTGTKPYSCPHCPYTCNTQENLRKHVLKSKKHQGLNVYTCPHCDYGCDWAKEMKEHLLDKHAELAKDANEDSPSFSSSLTGIYDREVDKEKRDILPIPYVPRTEKRAGLQRKQQQQQQHHHHHQQQRVITLTTSRNRAVKLDHDACLTNQGSNDELMIPVVIEDLPDASEDQIACEKLNEIISITGDETLVKQTKRKRGGLATTTYVRAKKPKKIDIAERDEYEVAIIEEQSGKTDNDDMVQEVDDDGELTVHGGPEDEELVMHGEGGEQIVLASPEDVENLVTGDNAELYHLLQGTSLMKSEILNHNDQEIAVFTIELPADHEEAILGLEDDSNILAAIPSDGEQQVEGLQSAILLPFGSVIATSDDNSEEQTLAFIQDDCMDPKTEGNTVLLYVPISS